MALAHIVSWPLPDTLALLSLGDEIRPGAYGFHSGFKHAVNFERDGRLISVVDDQIGPGPLNIVLGPSAFGLSLCDRERATDRASRPLLEIGPATVRVAGHSFSFTPRRRYHSTLDLDPTHFDRFRHNLRAFGEFLKRISPANSLAFLLDKCRLANFQTKFERAFAAQITRGVHQVFHGRLLDGIRNLKGCGPGLTPSGDDFIAGLLIGLHALGQLQRQNVRPAADAIFRAARGRNLFSNTFLDLARQGLLLGRIKDLLSALTTGNQRSVRQATVRLLAVGASSGADVATGFFFASRSRSVHALCIAAAKR